MSGDERAGIAVMVACALVLVLVVAFGHVRSTTTVTVVRVAPVTTTAPTTSSTSTVAGTVTCLDAFGNPVRTDRATALRSRLRCPNYSAGISEGVRP